MRWVEAPGARLHAWLVLPDSAPPWPLVVMAHGWAAVKEMNLDYFARAMSDAGVAALVFDHRGFGASEGLRGDIDPDQQIADYQFVLTVGAQIEGVDPGRLGIWGTSYSGGHVLCVAARDPRVKAAVAQVPTISGSEVTRRRRGADGVARLRRECEQEHHRLSAGHLPSYVPAADVAGHEIPGSTDPEIDDPVAPEALPPASTALYPDDERWRFYLEMPPQRRRTWRNRVTLLSWERYARYEPGENLSDLKTPLLVVFAEADSITPSDLIRRAIAGAPDSVNALEVPGGHYSVYGAHRRFAAEAAARFLSEHL